MQNITDKISSFKILPSGWYFGKGESISETSCQAAMDAVAVLHQKNITDGDAFPTAEGGVRLEFDIGEKSIDMRFSRDGLCTWSADLKGTEIADGKTRENLLDTVENILRMT